MSKVFTITEGLENMGALKTGGQGSVYKARRTGTIITAVKLLPTPIHSESPEDKHFADFQNEVAKLAKVSAQPHPNVVKILSSGITESGSFPYIEMEFIEGPDLEDLLHPPHDPVFTIKEAIKVADQLSNALAHCHRLGIKHGDVKSNNVKFNIHTGNYVLIDFGLAIMSDEQRRTSLRQAGAIEFMAPEQAEGRMLLQTDVYSFGIILYELLAGSVPFPLTNRGENARNAVRLQHMEETPPDILQQRRQKLPQSWSAERQEREMMVPQWLLHLIDRCLQKAPEDRFESGVELHDFLVQHSIINKSNNALQSDTAQALQATNHQLAQEKANLQKELAQQAAIAAAKEQELVQLRVALTRKDRELQAALEKQNTHVLPPKKKKNPMRVPLLLALIFIVGSLAYVAATKFLTKPVENNRPNNTETKAEQPLQPRAVIGQYKVVAERAYFHNEPDEATKRGAYMVPSEDVINALEEQNDFIYTEFTNSRGQTSKGWVKKEDLLPLEQWKEQQEQVPLTKIEINEQLQQAKALLANGNKEGALAIYKLLNEQEVPEAQFEWANRALKGEHNELDCAAAFELVQKSSERGYTPAKRTLGFLYLFGQNKEVLRLSGYKECTFERNVVRGTRLLMEAIAEGDSTANDLLNDFKTANPDGASQDSL